MQLRVTAMALASAALVTIGCGGVTSPSKNSTETFNGTVARGASGAAHSFNVSNTGEFTVKVTNLTPSYSGFFGVLYGQQQGDSCALIQANSFSIVNSPVLSGPIVKGSYCVQVFDTGGFTTTETYTLTVSHP